MNIAQYPFTVDKAGYFLILAPIGDEHFEGGTCKKIEIHRLKAGIEEARKMFKCPVGFIKMGDEFEYDRKSFSKKLKAISEHSDRKGHEIMARNMVKNLISNYDGIIREKDLKLGAVGGNHAVEFTVGREELVEAKNTGKLPALNSSELLAEKMGFPYLGDSHALIVLKIRRHTEQRRVFKILVLHGAGKGASPQADLVEFQKIRAMYGHIDLIIKAHSHKPLTTHMGRYNTDCLMAGHPVVDETTIVNCGSLRGAMGMGFTDYGEKCQYSPIPTRFPLIALRVDMSMSKYAHPMSIRAIPITF